MRNKSVIIDFLFCSTESLLVSCLKSSIQHGYLYLAEVRGFFVFLDINSIIYLVMTVFLILQLFVKRPIQIQYRGLKVGVEKTLLLKLTLQV